MTAQSLRQSPDQLLRRALTANALFSAVTGAALVTGAGPLARAFDVAEPLYLRVVGAGLLPFAAFVAWVARSRRPSPGMVRLISALDAGWVVGTVALAILLPGALNTVGWVAAVAVAASVDACCVGQMVGLRRAARAGVEAPREASGTARPAAA